MMDERVKSSDFIYIILYTQLKVFLFRITGFLMKIDIVIIMLMSLRSLSISSVLNITENNEH